MSTMGMERKTISGWLSFAGILGIMVGVFNAIDGLVALFRDEYYAFNEDNLIFFDLTGWGWFLLILGLIQLAVGIGILGGKDWARMAGIALAALAAFFQLLFIAAFPIWTLIVIGLCVLIIYALVVPQRNAVG